MVVYSIFCLVMFHRQQRLLLYELLRNSQSILYAIICRNVLRFDTRTKNCNTLSESIPFMIWFRHRCRIREKSQSVITLRSHSNSSFPISLESRNRLPLVVEIFHLLKNFTCILKISTVIVLFRILQ